MPRLKNYLRRVSHKALLRIERCVELQRAKQIPDSALGKTMASIKNKYLVLVCLINFSITIRLVESCVRSSVTLEKNGYKNILIGISEGVAEDPQLIERIKAILTEASEFLAVATRRRAYFAEVKILIPSTWNSIANAEDSTEEISRSDIVVANPDPTRDILGLAHAPFVIKATGCGEPGNFIHLTPSYILDENIGRLFGPYGKTIVHEWAHYRWGVYDEYPVDQNAPRFYAAEGGRFEGTRCSLTSPGYEFNPTTGGGCAYVNGAPEPNCIWKDQETDVVGRQGSLMYNHSLYHILEFCDNDPNNEFTLHNSNAPTMQNIQCNGKSVWEVMKEHSDFANGANPTRKIGSTVPEFKIIKPGVRMQRTVLVLDKSGSMGGGRITLLAQVCNNYITNFIRDGEQLAVVEFSNTATTKLDLTTVSSATKPAMQNAIPVVASGGTGIGPGLLKALSILAGNSNIEGGNIILVSDGEENVSPLIADVTQSILAAKVVVHTIAISGNAELKMETLARQTGGLTYFLNTAGASNDANDALREIAQRNLDESQKDIGLDSTATDMVIGETVLRSAFIDSTIGANTQFIFDYSGNTVAFTVTSPSGKVYDMTSSNVTCLSQFKACTLRLDGIAETGSWRYSIRNTATAAQRVAVTVTSQAVNGSSPISAQAFWGDSIIDMTSSVKRQVLYASVSKGYTPILGADVKATVETPGGTKVIVELRDTGTGADVTKDDGVYSAYFVSFNGNGRYAVQVTVNSTDSTTISPGRVLGMKAASTGTGAHDSSVESFQRIAPGGSFQLQNIVSGSQIYEPGRINDLRVSNVNYDLQTVTLEWTAVGRELDQGRASHYQLRYATNFTELKNDFSSQAQITPDMILDNKTLSDPSLPGEREVFRIKMPATGNITYVFGLVVWDTNGRNVKGPLSNFASASMLFREHPALTTSSPEEQTQTQEQTTQPTVSTSTSTKKTESVTGNGNIGGESVSNKNSNGPMVNGPTIIKTQPINKLSTELVITGSLGFILISIACIITIILCLRHHMKVKHMKYAEMGSYPIYPPETIPSRPTSSRFPVRLPRFFPASPPPRQYHWNEVPANASRRHAIDVRQLSIYDSLPY